MLCTLPYCTASSIPLVCCTSRSFPFLHLGPQCGYLIDYNDRPLTDPIVPPGYHWVWMGPTLVQPRVPSTTLWSRPLSFRCPQPSQTPSAILSQSRGNQNSWAHEPDPHDRPVLTRRWSGMCGHRARSADLTCLAIKPPLEAWNNRTSLETPVNRSSDQVYWSDPTGETKRSRSPALIRCPPDPGLVIRNGSPDRPLWLTRLAKTPPSSPTARASSIPLCPARHLTSIYPDTKATRATPRSGIQRVGHNSKT
eukprot:g34178.t1